MSSTTEECRNVDEVNGNEKEASLTVSSTEHNELTKSDDQRHVDEKGGDAREGVAELHTMPLAIPMPRPPATISGSILASNVAGSANVIASNVAGSANAIAQAFGDFARMAMPSPQQLLAQPELRHTHSTPLQFRKSNLYEDGDEEELIPPPVPLDPFQRSSSTPSSFRQRSANSAFGVVNQTSRTNSQYAASGSAFDVVRYYASGIDEMERTSIEVTDARLPVPEMTTDNRKPAFIAKKYLSRFPVLKRRLKKKIGGRENPAQPASVSSDSKGSDSGKEDGPVDATVTVVSEPHGTNLADISFMSRSSEVSAIIGGEAEGSSEKIGQDESNILHVSSPTSCDPRNTAASEDSEDELVYEKIETQLEGESPTPIASPSYQKLESPVSHSETSEQPKTRKIRIQVSDTEKPSRSSSLTSPLPSSRVGSNESAEESPGTRSSHTGSSGHTTNTSFSSGSFLQSGLSTISETDREVMEANKEGRRRRKFVGNPWTSKKSDNDGSSIHSASTSTTNSSINPHGYIPLNGGSPASLREGAAVVPGERTLSLGSRRSQGSRSPTGTSSLSLSNTTSSSVSGTAEPPTFVSYLEREESSESERTSGAPQEARDGSPAPQVTVRFDMTASPGIGLQRRSMERSHSRPPLSPTKGRPPITPPPRVSVSPMYLQLSPPRNLVEQYVDGEESKIPRPAVLRSAPGVGPTEEVANRQSHMYEEKNVEVLQSVSGDNTIASVVTPEKQQP